LRATKEVNLADFLLWLHIVGAGRIRQTAARLGAWGTLDTLILLFTIYVMVARLGS